MEREDIRVYHSNHAGLTVVTLRAVEPDGCGVVDHDGIDGHLSAGFDGHEAGEEAGNIGLVVHDGLARLAEGGLHDGVVL